MSIELRFNVTSANIIDLTDFCLKGLNLLDCGLLEESESLRNAFLSEGVATRERCTESGIPLSLIDDVDDVPLDREEVRKRIIRLGELLRKFEEGG